MVHLRIKKLVTFGCSFVHGSAIYDKTGIWVGERFSFTPILGHKLGISSYYNNADPGLGNESMLRRIFKHFKKDYDHSDSLVVIGLSGITRQEVYSNAKNRLYDHHLFDYIDKESDNYKRKAKQILGNEELHEEWKVYLKIQQKYLFNMKSEQEKLHWQLIHLDGYFKSKGIRYVIFNSVEDNITPIKKDINYLSFFNPADHRDIKLSGITELEDSWVHKLRLDHHYNVHENFNLNEYKNDRPPYGKYFCSGHPSPDAHKELANQILNYINENNI